MALRALILYANPVTVSFGATLHSQVVTTLRSRGHEIDDCDLYAESFDPVMGEQERIQYHDTEVNERRSRPMRNGCWRRRRWSSSIQFGTRDFPRS
jgi:NAD(P)H dehydrogenase (quinone)